MIEIFKSQQDGKLSVILPEVYEREDFAVKDCWINLTNPSDKEVALISKISGVEDEVLKTPLDDEERSRVEMEDDFTLVLVDIPVIEEGPAEVISYEVLGYTAEFTLEDGKTTLALLDEMVDGDSELVSLYYGESVTKEQADKLTAQVEEKYPDVEVETNFGGQPIYYYMVSVE